ncbi:MAG: TIM barrel protein [Lentisphaerota bacterium]
MIFSLSTRWNAGRHTRGEDMIQEILDLGLQHVELGYDLRIDLTPGVLDMVRRGAVRVTSVHNFCPVPVGAPHGHPELFTLGDPDRRIRESAVTHTTRTIRFAAEVGARVVIVHAGNVEMERLSEQLMEQCAQGQQFNPHYERTKLKLQVSREKKAGKQIKYLYEGIENLLPVLQETEVKLALENLPTWESIPTETEMETLLKHFNSPYLAHWHDIGHGKIRENLGFINHERWLTRLQPWLAGLHIHDVEPPAKDHLMPPEGKINFSRLRKFAELDIHRVLEPAPRTPSEKIVNGLSFLRKVWEEKLEPQEKGIA